MTESFFPARHLGAATLTFVALHLELIDATISATRQGIGTTLEAVDQRNVNNLQTLEPNWRKHGKRSFRGLTPIGAVSFDRLRFLNKRNNKTCVPSTTWWKTKQNSHFSKSLNEKCKRLALVMSYREAAEYVAKDANDRLLSASTIWSLLQTLCQSSESVIEGATDRFLSNILNYRSLTQKRVVIIGIILSSQLKADRIQRPS